MSDIRVSLVGPDGRLAHAAAQRAEAAAADAAADATAAIAPAVADAEAARDAAEAAEAGALLATYGVRQLLDGFDDTLDTGAVLVGIDPAIGGTSYIVTNYLIEVDRPEKDTTYTQAEIYHNFLTTNPKLVVMVEEAGGWVYYDHIEITNPGVSGPHTHVIDLFAPAGSRVCAIAPAGGRFGVTTTQSADYYVASSDDPTLLTTPITFSTIAYAPKIRLTGTYSELVEKGIVKRQLETIPMADRDGIHNLTSGQTEQIRAALADVRAGTGNATILVIGTSITTGAGAGTTGYWGDSLQRGFMGQLAAMLPLYYDDGLFIPVQYNRLGTGSVGNGELWTDYDPRYLAMGDFQLDYPSNPSYTSLGGGVLRSPSAGGNTALQWQHGSDIDEIELRYYRLSTTGQFRYRIDGGSWTTVDTANASNTYETLTIPVTLGDPLLEIERVVGTGDVIIQAIMGWNTEQPCVRLINAGWSGGVYLGLTVQTNPWSPATRLGAETADLKILEMGANDISSSTVPDTLAGNLMDALESMAVNSDVAILTPLPKDDTGTTTEAIQLAVRQAIFAAAATDTRPLVDLYGWFGSWATADTGRALFDDNIHPSYTGHTLMADVLKKLIGRLG